VKLVGRVPVEPLSEERLTNVERRLVVGVSELAAPPIRAPRRLLAFAGAAMAVAAAGVIGWKLHGAPVAAPVADPPIVAVNAGVLDIGDATIASDATTTFDISRPAGGVLVDMKHGKVELEVAKRHGRPPLIVRAGDTDVEVVGTHFSVAWDGHGEVDVRVTEGVVKVVHHQVEVARVEAGTQWTSGGGGVVAIAAPQVEPPERIDVDVKATPDLLHGHQAAVPAASGSDAPVKAAGSGSAAKTHVAGTSDPLKAVRNLGPKPTIAVASGTEQEVMARYREAYSALPANATFDDKSKILFSEAVVEHMMFHNDDAADRILEGVVRKEGGLLYNEGLALRLRIRCYKALDEKCREAARTYLHADLYGSPAGIAQEILSHE
jgi:hypothetical protein